MFRIIDYGSDSYTASLQLRERVLRVPLGLVLSPEDMKGEQQQRHFGIFRDGELVACVVAKPTSDPSRVKLRQMAVAESLRGAGVGRMLLREVETLLQASGVRSIELAARRVAEGFYRKLGYTAVGSPFVEVGIEHITMEKMLGNGGQRIESPR